MKTELIQDTACAANTAGPTAAQWLYILGAEMSGMLQQSEYLTRTGNTMQNEKLASRTISLLERIHTASLLLIVFGWELYHFYMLLFEKR